MTHGWLILDKPEGLGSTQAVAAVKRNLREGGYARCKVGHGGTLDPLAQGVLPIALGEATKLAGRLLDASKIYAFTIAFGAQTDTLDGEGKTVETSAVRPTSEALIAVLARFVGKIEQVPPAFSAVKIDGKRAYDRARSGEVVVPRTRKVEIHRLDLYDKGTGAALLEEVTLLAHVSKGTYIRALARDIASALDTCGHVTYLRRIKAGPFTEAGAISLDKLNEIGKGAPLQDVLLPLEAGLDDIPALCLDQTDAQAVRQGRILSELSASHGFVADGLYLAKRATVPVALMQVRDDTARVVRGFNIPDVADEKETTCL